MNLEDKDIDKLFREGLGDMELPYDTEGWSKMKTKLKKAKLIKIWSAIGIVALIIGLSAFLYISFSDFNSSNSKLSINQNEQNISDITAKNDTKTNESNITLKEKTDVNSSIDFTSENILNQQVNSSSLDSSNHLKTTRKTSDNASQLAGNVETYSNTTGISNKIENHDNSGSLSNNHSQKTDNDSLVFHLNSVKNSNRRDSVTANNNENIDSNVKSINSTNNHTQFDKTKNESLSTNITQTFSDLSTNKANTKLPALKPYKYTTIDSFYVNILHNDSVMIDFGKDTSVWKGAWGIDLISGLSSVIKNNEDQSIKISIGGRLGFSFNYFHGLSKNIDLITGVEFEQLNYSIEALGIVKWTTIDNYIVQEMAPIVNNEKHTIISPKIGLNVFSKRKKTTFYGHFLYKLNVFSGYDNRLSTPLDIEYDNLYSSIENNSSGVNSTVTLGFGLDYSLSKNWNLYFQTEYQQFLFPENSSMTTKFTPYTIDLRIGIKKNIFKTIKTPPSFK